MRISNRKASPLLKHPVTKQLDSMTMNVEESDEVVVDKKRKAVIFGSTTLSRISKHRNWSPGSYINENFEFNQWKAGFGVENLLNGDAVVSKVKDAANLCTSDSAFLRPTEDTKAFAGTVMSKAEFEKWQSNISKIPEEEFSPLHKNTDIIISSTKEIESECRVFVVDGKIVASSMYKQGSRVITSVDVPTQFIEFAKQMVDLWQPARAFVIDVAKTALGFKVIEINNINSSGFYKADVYAIVKAIKELEQN